MSEIRELEVPTRAVIAGLLSGVDRDQWEETIRSCFSNLEGRTLRGIPILDVLVGDLASYERSDE